MSSKESCDSDDENHQLGKRQQTAKGFLYMVLVTITNLMADTISKMLVDQVSIFLIAMMRGLVMLLLATPFMFYNSISLRDSASEWKFLSLRGLMSALSALARVAALSFAPLGDVSAITASTPILAAFWSWVILGEVITLFETSFAVISSIGICLIAQPPDLFSPTSSDANKITLVFGVGLAILGSIFASLGIVLNRKLSQSDVHVSPLVQVFYYSFITTVLNITALGVTLPVDHSHVIPTPRQGLLLLTIGFLSLLKQLFLTGALKLEKAIYVTTSVYSISIILAYTVQYLCFHDIPTMLSVIGGSLCIVGTVGFLLSKLQD